MPQRAHVKVIDAMVIDVTEEADVKKEEAEDANMLRVTWVWTHEGETNQVEHKFQYENILVAWRNLLRQIFYPAIVYGYAQ